jgi:hypothetical protein
LLSTPRRPGVGVGFSNLAGPRLAALTCEYLVRLRLKDGPSRGTTAGGILRTITHLEKGAQAVNEGATPTDSDTPKKALFFIGGTVRDCKTVAVNNAEGSDPRFLVDSWTLEKRGGNGRRRKNTLTAAERREARRVFLDAFRKTGNITTAARLARVARSTIYNWQEHDEGFSCAFKQAGVEATENLEAEAWRRAVKGVEHVRPILYGGKVVAEHVTREYSDTLLIFLLKGRAPEKYRDNMTVRHYGAPLGEHVSDDDCLRIARHIVEGIGQEGS